MTVSLLGLSALIFLIILISSVLFRIYTHPIRVKIRTFPSDYGLDFKELEFVSAGVFHKAWLIFPPGLSARNHLPTVVTTHGYAANRAEILDRSAFIARAGFLVFTFDWRACGESGGKACSGGLLERVDLMNALEFLRRQEEVDSERIAIYGFSMGASLSIIAVAEDTAIKCVVADSPYSSLWEIAGAILKRFLLPKFLFLRMLDRKFVRHFGNSMKAIDVVKAAGKIAPRPILLLGGRKDHFVPISHSEAVYKAALEPKLFHVEPNGGHFDNASRLTLEEIIVPFLSSQLGEEQANSISQTAGDAH